MKTSTIILYIVIAAVVYYLIYKAYTNYKASGSIFSSGHKDGTRCLITSGTDLNGMPMVTLNGLYKNGVCQPPVAY